MQMRPLGSTGFEIAPFVLGGNVFGWTADERTSFRLLDAFVDAGLNAIDTADAYSTWVPGSIGGDSETDHRRLAGREPGQARQGRASSPRSARKWARARRACRSAGSPEAVEDSLRRLRIEAIDVYLSHWPDPATPYAETLGPMRS